jgi:ADP-ribose pyrophosphatase YjhB (NUDIX family)
MKAAHRARTAAWWVLRPITLGVRGLVVDPEGRILLVRHTYRRGWFLPGGAIDRGETAADAVARELREEAGIAVREPIPELFGVYYNVREYAHDHVILFVVREWDAGRPTQTGEIAEVGFFAPDALPDGVTSATQRRMTDLQAGRPLTAHW